jgi:hypothetical protein
MPARQAGLLTFLQNRAAPLHVHGFDRNQFRRGLNRLFCWRPRPGGTGGTCRVARSRPESPVLLCRAWSVLAAARLCLDASIPASGGGSVMETRQKSYVEIGIIFVKGGGVFTVRVLDGGKFSFKAHCGAMVGKVPKSRLTGSLAYSAKRGGPEASLRRLAYQQMAARSTSNLRLVKSVIGALREVHG